ncbi:MAG: oxygenase MpaB family protein [Phototrophicales bacterium]|nr:oxygenase MpaB family protein [Phototrophicales bacterium]
MSRYAILNQVKQLDPITDNQQIVFLTGAYEYPWLTQRALEFALFRTYAVPSISELLAKTAQFEHHGQRRYDDTALIIAEIVEYGYDSERGRVAIKQMNRLHGRFDISNEDFLYVLSTFIYEPIRWNERYGWREVHNTERLASYYFWREVGTRMNIKHIPPTYAEFEAFNIAYERENFRYTATNHQVGEATMRVFLGWYPKPLHPIIRQVIYSLLDEPLREAFGYEKPASIFRMGSHYGLHLLRQIIRLTPPRKTPYRLTNRATRTYPFGYRTAHIGPIDDKSSD